jgi:hypothetical protein
MHGEDDVSCEKYFCGEHLSGTVKNDRDRYVSVCADCEKEWREQNPEEAEALDDE